MLRKRVAVVVAAATLASLSLFSPAGASHSWASYHWARTANPFPLQVGNNVTGTWPTPFGVAVVDWDGAPVLGLSPVTGTSNKRCSMVAGTVQVCNGTYGRNGWLGLASINIKGDHITQGTAKLNDTYFNTAAYNNPDEKQHVMCQEIGHTFGLGHTSEDGSSQNTCMDYSQSSTSTHPNQHDYDQLGTIYAHLDSTTTVAAATSATNRSEVGNDRSTWGQEIERGVHGEFSVFERDFGGGEKVITHVTWANDRQAVGQSSRPE